ncbi:MAG: leucine-rich repeat domain-containing protein [Clostridia bacterium]|nr:leucine-rich repeat domain-containing protein [Clostridia bacterium]
MKKIAFVFLVILLAFTIVCCDSEGMKAAIDSIEIVNGELVVKYSNGSSRNFGRVDLNSEGTDGLSYYPLIDGTYEVSIGAATSEKIIVIPSSYNGIPVTKIADNGFSENKTLEQVVIPQTVTRIGYHAFGLCSNLKSIEIPNSVIELEDSAFFWCEGLESVTLSENIKEINPLTFSGCFSLAELNIPVGTQYIGREAFAYSKIAEITIPDSVEIIDGKVFEYCVNLETVYCEAEIAPNGWSENWLYGCQAEVFYGYKGTKEE